MIITRGDRGAVIYSQIIAENKNIHDIPSFPPEEIVDPTGLGDTFMAAYAVKKLETPDPVECGRFAAHISSLKMGQKGALFEIKRK